MTVQGFGTAEGVPDLATISLGVQTQAPKAAAALRENATKATALLATLKTHGVATADIQTSGLSVQPVYNNQGSKITGYQVANTVTVTLHNLALAGPVIDDAARAAGNAVRVNDIAFSVRDPTALMGQARGAAVDQASGQAQVMATAAGMTLGRLCSLKDESSPPETQPVNESFSAATPAAVTPVEAGSEQVTADVTAVYELAPLHSAGTPTTS